MKESNELELEKARRRLVRPPWLNGRSVIFGLGAAGLLMFAIEYSFCFAFLHKFGTTPEEVGLSQPDYIIHAGVFGVIVLGTIAFFVSYFLGLLSVASKPLRGVDRAKAGFEKLIWFWRRLPIIRNRQPKDAAGRQIQAIKRRTLLVSLACTAVVSPIGILYVSADNFYGTLTTIGLDLLVFIGQWAVLYAIARYRLSLAVFVALAGLFIGVMFLAQPAGERVATDFMKDGRTGFPLNWIGLQADPVKVTASDGQSLGEIPEDLTLLGHTDHVFLLADSTRLYRVRDDQVVVTFTLDG